MGYCDLHTHTTFCDGKSTPREMVLSAIDKGITTLGLLAHSYVDFDKNYAIDPARVEDFRAEVADLKEEFKDKIEILFGIEADYYASEIYGGTDYIIGSVHYLKFEDGFRSVDMSREELLRVVGLSDKADAYPCQLSGGQQQRVAIARALMLAPDILCFDEPTSSLDPELTGEVLRVIRSLKDSEHTMIIVTHEMEFARNVADRVIFIADGVIEEMGTPEEVFEHPKSDKTRAFLAAGDL